EGRGDELAPPGQRDDQGDDLIGEVADSQGEATQQHGRAPHQGLRLLEVGKLIALGGSLHVFLPWVLRGIRATCVLAGSGAGRRSVTGRYWSASAVVERPRTAQRRPGMDTRSDLFDRSLLDLLLTAMYFALQS
ncbi:MAG: hypothetical protein QOC85_3984, partial [Streptomyces sp.]|nr:hypothetical protein [Streptomyces sp.]